MGTLTFVLSLIISVNSTLNCYVDLEKKINDTYSNSISYISLVGNLIETNPSAISAQASVTVFTPGMGGAGTDWYLIDSYNSSHMYYGGLSLSPLADAQTISIKNTTVYDPSNSNQTSTVSLESLYFPSATQNGSIDFSKPLFLVYEGPSDWQIDQYKSNEQLYFNFAQAIDSFLYHYYEAFGIIPKINLIGHSRGGLVNMIYAINHPQIIASFMSVGTPYLGSEWAAVLYYLEEALVSVSPTLNPEHTPYYGVVGGSFQNEYAESWNDIVDEYGFPTKIVGCGYSGDLFSELLEDSLGALLSGWINTFSTGGLEYFSNLASTVVQDVIDFLISVIIDRNIALAGLIVNGVLDTALFALSLMEHFNSTPALQYISDAFTQAAYVLNVDAFVPLGINDKITSDFAVNLNSQVGKTRDGTSIFDFDSVELLFEWDDIVDSRLSQPNNPPILHNYEAKSPLVKSEFTSLLQANPSCRHTHSFGVSNSGNAHTFSCVCGASFHTCQGSYAYSNYNAIDHLKTCSLCHYSRLVPHSFFYTSYDANGHSGYCQDCGRQIVNGAHDFIYSGTLNSHVGMCPCGYSVLEPHTYIGGKCIKCNRRKPGFGF